MATAMKKCKVCGADYEYCHTLKNTIDIFRWQDVACCPEHGSIYFAEIIKSRQKSISPVIDDLYIYYEEDDDDYEEDLEDFDDE